MLPRANRVTRPDDFRAVLRRGRRVGGALTVIHVIERDEPDEPRLGFIVTKTVGNAVTRNFVKRRMRAAGARALATMPAGTDVVIRALPASADAAWVSLLAEITEGISMGTARR